MNKKILKAEKTHRIKSVLRSNDRLKKKQIIKIKIIEIDPKINFQYFYF